MDKKARKIVDDAIKKAKQEKDKNGYRENLGYDQFYLVKEKVEKLDLNYTEICKVMDYFNSQCDSI